MKIIHYLKLLIAKIKIRRMKHNFSLTPLADCEIRYFINKYINETKPDDYIEAYEQNIEKNKERALKIEFFKKMSTDETGKINPAYLHYSAMMLSLTMLLFAAKNAEYYYELIEKENYKDMVKRLVNLFE